ncbi:MAG: hypothetical protein H0W02_14985 [Ktedonobacteraceae bacterium]|nr:hypothetical protein [Ktedonobacteraceae bacterium]
MYTGWLVRSKSRQQHESSLQFPPRPVLCLRPLDSTTLPRRFLKRITLPSPKTANE